ncbi:MAG: hypothetical protein JO212_01260, partial [Acetobacteraceae bacterium]|nr:hypothetical protein [Acetobacteraceae bacterium]
MTEGVPTTTIDAGSLRPPPLWQLPLEALSLLECVLGIVAMPVLMRASRGDGHPVLVLPGLLAADGSTALLRWYLARLGYRPFGWELGRNVKSIGNSEPKLRARLAEVGERSGGKVSLVGWSLGGVLARLLARAMPDHVRRV